MKETTDKTPLIDEIKEAWSDAEPMTKFSLIWVSMLVIGLITVGIIFPIVGIIMLAIVAVFITIGVVGYLMDEF